MATAPAVSLTPREKKILFTALELLHTSAERQIKQRGADDPIGMAHAEHKRDIEALTVKLRQLDLFT